MHAISLFGYLDATTGSLIVQSLIGVAAGIAVFGRRFIFGIRHKIASLFGRNKTADK